MRVFVNVLVKNCDSRMIPEAAERFTKLREITRAGCGFDFLAICGDILRAANYVSSKDGVANRSWHKTGRAFDYDQTSKLLVLVSEIINGKQFFRTFLKCSQQNGTQGEFLSVRDKRGFSVTAYLFDFTKAAENLGFERIPAWNGWQNHYNRQEFWHYQFDEGLTWAAAMAQLKAGSVAVNPETDNEIGLNDRGANVRKLQTRLNELKLLPSVEIDGVFGSKSRQAVIEFQKSVKLPADGIAGAQTLKALQLVL